MNVRNVVLAFGAAAAALGAALFTSPTACADDTNPPGYPQDSLFPPGTTGPIGDPTNVQSVSFLVGYHHEDDLYHVVTDGNLVGQFTDSHSFVVIPSPTVVLLPFFQDTKDVISDSTYPGLADGATQETVNWGIGGPDVPIPLITTFYLNNPGIETEYFFRMPEFTNDYLISATGTSDVVTLFGQAFTLFDYPAAGAVDPSWLTDLTTLF